MAEVQRMYLPDSANLDSQYANIALQIRSIYILI